MPTCNLRDYRRLLATPIGISLLRIDLALDLYARNPFRMLAVPAWLGDEQRDTLIQRFRNLYKLRPESALKDILRIGYEEYAEIHDHLGLLNDLYEPQRRVVWELFWPHVSPEDFQRITAGGVLTIPRKEATSPATPAEGENTAATKDILRISQEEFSEIRHHPTSPSPSGTPEPLQKGAPSGGQQPATSPREKGPTAAAIWAHTLAVLHHNRALAIEFSIGGAIATEPAYARLYRVGADEHWKKSLEYWAVTIANPIFWEYLKERIAIFDDPQLQPSHIEPLRDGLPAAILAFNATLVRAYVGAGCMEDAARQMRLIGNNRFHLPTQQAIVVGLLREVANAWLNPMIQQLENQHPHRKCTWQEVRDWLMPILALAEKLPIEIKEKFGADEVTLAEMQFDNLAERVFDGIGPEVIDYQKSNRRMLLFLILMCRHLLNLPLSSSLRRKIEGRRGEYIEALYGRFYENPSQARQLDPSECWFLPGELADPETSILIPVVRNMAVTGATASWYAHEVLIPRSRLAEIFHMGKMPMSSLRDQRQSEVEKFTSMVDVLSNEAERDRVRLEAACANAIAQEKNYWQTRMKALDEEMFPEENTLKTSIKKIEDFFRPRIAEVDARLTVARATVNERWLPALTAAHKTITRLEPIGRLARVTLPLAGILAVAVAIATSTLSAAYAWTFQYLAPIESILRERFYASDRMIDFLPIVVATLLTIVLAVVFAELLLSGKMRTAQKALEKIERRQEEDFAWIDQVVDKQREVILSEQEVQLTDQRAKLSIITQRREEFLHEMNQVVEEIQNRHRQELERRQETLNNQLRRLRQQQEAYQNSPKITDEKSDFPAYLEALRVGYQPSDRSTKQETRSSGKNKMAKLWPF